MSDRTELSQLGEFGLIDLITKDLELRNANSICGVGDDAAVIDHGTHVSLVSTDMLVEGVHFDMSYTPLRHLGYKAITVNLSDIYAMNGRPEQVTVAIALSNRFSAEAVAELYEGMKLACIRYGVDLVGGDTTSSVSGMIISITAIGRADKARLAYRRGATEHDLVCVSGDLGAAYIGLQILEREKEVWKASPDIQPDLDGYDYVLERILKPEPRADVVEALEKAGVIPTSMIDVSDGLGSEILHLCKASGCGMRIYEEKLPIDATVVSQCKAFNLEPSVCALNGGEDYELLFTIAQGDHEKVSQIPGISIIGHVTDAASGAAIVYPQGEEIQIKAQGWTSF